MCPSPAWTASMIDDIDAVQLWPTIPGRVHHLRGPHQPERLSPGQEVGACHDPRLQQHPRQSPIHQDRSRRWTSERLMATRCVSGACAGRTYLDIYNSEMNYVRAMIGKLRNGSLSNPHITNFAKYALRRRQQDFPDQYPPGSSAYMMTDDKLDVDDGKQQILAIRDTGCKQHMSWQQMDAAFHRGPWAYAED